MTESKLTQKTMDIMQATAPIIGEQGVLIVSRMYQNMFRDNPEIKPFFNQANQSFGEDKTRASQIETFNTQAFGMARGPGSQAISLTQAVVNYAKNLQKGTESLGPSVLRIAHKHASLNILPEHYPIVGKHLIGAFKEILGPEVATQELLDAWHEGYEFLASIMIGFEEELRRENAVKVGGWNGFRKCVVVKKVKESEEVYSFYLKPQDGGPLPPYKAGQYTCFKLDIPGQGIIYRSYTLSTAPGKEHFRVSVKREVGVRRYPHGLCSNYFHDNVKVGDVLDMAPPYGELTLVETKLPYVFMAGGIGITPMFSMLQAAVEAKLPQDIYFIQSMRNRRLHPLEREVRKVCRLHSNVKLHTIYSQPDPTDLQGEDYDMSGHLNAKTLKELVPSPEAEFYFTGPVKFMRDMRIALREWGVPPERIHYECFGPMAAEIEGA